MDNAEEYAVTASTDPSVRGMGKTERRAGAQSGLSTETVGRGKNKSARSFDWQDCVKDHPYLTLGLAAGAGMLLVGLLKPRSTAKKRLVKTLGNNLAGASRRLERGVGSLAEKPARVGTSIKAAAATMATKALKTYLKRRLINTFTPGHKRRMWF